MTRRLRIAHLVVQPVLVWDDGEELSPGPSAQPLTVPLSGLARLAETLPGQVADVAEKLAAAEQPQPRTCSEVHPSEDIYHPDGH